MRMPPFQLHTPTSLDEAISISDAVSYTHLRAHET